MKHQAVYEWLKQYPPLYEILYFNTVQEFMETTGVNTVFSDDVVQEYTTGSADKEYIFAIVQMKPYDSSGTSTINLESIQQGQAFMDWVKEQNDLKNFPKFPEGCTVYEVRNLQNMPELAGVSEAGDVAKYMFQCVIRYEERR